MEFVHRHYQIDDTIAAVATPPGEGGVAIIRISGKEALSVAEKIFSGPVRSYQSHTAHFGRILDEEGRTIDEVLLLPMLGSRSYTGEDTVEIHCHGGSLITRKVLQRVIQAGARPAAAGEFTFKAFMHGKLDLAQAEAVQNLIGARSELALHFAEQQLQGALSKTISEFQRGLTDLAAILEAWVDFPEEGLEFASMEEVVEMLTQIREKMERLSQTFYDGKRLHEGLSLCLAGPPNAGKSSLMNALLGKERAIVTEIPGTTRDLLEADLSLGDLNFRLVDTAGIRKTDERIEQEGIARSRQAILDADLVLLVFDAAQSFSDEDRALLDAAQGKRALIIWNKIDLLDAAPEIQTTLPSICISAKERRGLEELKEEIDKLIWKSGLPSKEEVLITSLRHREALARALAHLETLISGLKTGISPEFLSSDMRAALSELGTIIGTNITEDILSAIFSKFCVGK
ncbi:MAG: tRNA uridine-5-carboxymethylaminomethyl(34) synthesis GTPase MnmE [Chlamydiales bacterium]|nr:tRNA uridine-5-carboxymethylaminomethyl(34) synthesis GTPase MnmE [Chlamydiales bacterium]